jgi:guanosine-3',5'-bis(diphosphate) 3'-pyrophosphohydrolase
MFRLGQVMEDVGIGGRVEIIVNGYWQAWQKLRRAARMRKASLHSFASVNDLISFRLVVESEKVEDCYLLLAAVNRFWGANLDQDRFDDYIAFPQNGYRALQVTGWIPDTGAVEVAIMTNDMEGENLWGVIYAIQQHKDITSYNPVEILTPTGGTRFLPEGSTVLDAVASIQQEFLLDKISAVQVNGTIARLADIVNPGDVVEVITGGKRLDPTEEWLKYCNNSTARLLRVVLATESLRQSGEKGRNDIKLMLQPRGVLGLEDVYALERDKFDNLLERLGSSSLQDLYSAVGGGAIPLADLEVALDEVGITKAGLDWTSIDIEGNAEGNRPGVLARLAGLVSDAGGNIVRTVNNTRMDGSFTLRLVLKKLPVEKLGSLREAYQNSGIGFTKLDIV